MVKTMPIRMLVVLGLGVAGAMLSGCRGDRSDKPPRELLPGMDDQPRVNPQTSSEFYAEVDKRSMRKPVVGTVAFARRPLIVDGDEAWMQTARNERRDLLEADPKRYLGLVREEDPAEVWRFNTPALWVERIPGSVDMAMLERGQDRFNIYCAACHGYSGAGGKIVIEDGVAVESGGMVGRRFNTPPPSYHDPKYQRESTERTGRDGYLFYTAMFGVEYGAKMPGYAHALSTDDAWAVVAYIRALQQSRRATLADVPQEQRRILERQRGASAGVDASDAQPGGGGS